MLEYKKEEMLTIYNGKEWLGVMMGAATIYIDSNNEREAVILDQDQHYIYGVYLDNLERLCFEYSDTYMKEKEILSFNDFIATYSN